jgi:YggT family protein
MPERTRVIRWSRWLCGIVAGLLFARLIIRLFAARPDNPAFDGLLGLTAPLVAPLAPLDALQPRFGAVLELSTLAALGVLVIALIALARR